MTFSFYTLDENLEPIKADPEKAAEGWISNLKVKKVAETDLWNSTISTVFLGFNHGPDDEDPILWETMIFGGELHDYQKRCGGSRGCAKAMHTEAVELVKQTLWYYHPIRCFLKFWNKKVKI